MANPQFSYWQTTFLPGSFYSNRRHLAVSKTLPAQLKCLKDTGRYDAFKLQWKPVYGQKPTHWPVPNHLFWDSDVAKWIEGACYFLKDHIDNEIDFAVTELVEMIRSAQQPDGYLNIHFTVVAPEQRFTNLRDLHELYNAGHLIEAALAHHQTYGSDRLLAPILKYVDLLCQVFGQAEGQIHGYPGHPEIELALLRLCQVTKDPRHLKLARYFITQRGNPKGVNGSHYYDFEAQARGDRENEMPSSYPQKRSYWYQQAHKPLIEQETIEGHSVRAMYLLTGTADLVLLDPKLDRGVYRETLFRLWNNMVEQKMYLTGGIGAIKQWEGFGINYFLPQSTDEGGAYSETCASIGVMMLAERLLQMDLNAKYADVMELSFFNVVMGGMSARGTEFTYVNQLASSDNDRCQRFGWFECACCPPNVTRLLGYLGGYLWSSKIDLYTNAVTVNVHMYGSATLDLSVGEEKVTLSQQGDWPWDGKITFHLEAPEDIEVTLNIRIPGWTQEWEISPGPPSTRLKSGYLRLPSHWLRENPLFILNVPLIPRFIAPHPYTNQDIVALQRGPIVYCAEDVDNPWVTDHFRSLLVDPSAPISEHNITDSATSEAYVALTLDAPSYFIYADEGKPGLELGSVMTVPSPAQMPKHLNFVPYYFRGNRGGNGQMRVGLRRKR